MSNTFLSEGVKNTEPTAGTRRLYVSVGKRVFDIVFVVLSLPFVLPILAALWLLILLDGGQGIYGQQRVGVGGRVFKCWKIRTMVLDADAVLARLVDERPDLSEEWNTNQKLECDPRITWWGRLLRRASLDELPQLLNVLKGEMSL
ncbi:MAG: sugar transferase, partial [Marinosulfonomonas sp.]|nr:sugar transferase [Marinosulfonomonas sp.]